MRDALLRDWARRNPRPARYALVLVCCLIGGLAARVWMALAGVDPASTLGLAAPPVAIGLGVVVAILISRRLGLTPF